MELSVEFQYFILFSALLLLPKILLRYRVPTALTALGLGFITNLTLGWFEGDQLLLMLSRLGITSLFLFAGMEVNLTELKEDSGVLLKHLATIVALYFVVGYFIDLFFNLGFRPSLILSLGIMTPSTGFILHSLKGIDLSENQEKWVRSFAIAKELVAILLLFFILQTESWKEFLVSMGALIAIVMLLPLVFRFFLSKIAPFAPDSEVSFLILIALLCGVITTKVGTYYLVGAFIVGMTAGRFRHFMEHKDSKNMLYSVSFFFSFFVPFYFYRAGLLFTPDMISWKGVGLGVLFLLFFIPLRFYSVIFSIWMFMRDFWPDRRAISTPLIPTLIFGLVIVNVLRERYFVPDFVLAGLLIYTIGTSVLPWFFLRRMPPENYDVSMVK